MENPAIIFFDWHGTLCSDLFWKSLRKENVEVARITDRLFNEKEDGLIDDWMLGRKSSEDITRAISLKTSLPYELLWEAFIKDCQTTTFDLSLRQLIMKVRARAKTVLITGNVDCFRRFIVPTLGLEECFDQIIISSETGRHKDEDNGSLFKESLAFFDISAELAVLIDDSEKCCAVFDKIGGQAFKTTGPEETKKILNRLLI